MPNTTPTSHIKKRSTGRPRSQASHDAILQATSSLLDSKPYAEVSIEAIAARAGVSKATIYRWWPNKVSLVIEVLTTEALQMPQLPFDGHHLRKHLFNCLKGSYNTLLRGRMAVVLLAVLAECRSDESMLKLLYSSFFARLQAIGLRDMQLAVATGELDQAIRQDVLLDQLWGPLYYRALIAGNTVDDAYLEALLDNLAWLKQGQ
jgi:AcrR family transcriptional regulator